MRRLSKPWPPGNVSPDGQTPRRFVDAEREYLTALPDSSDRVGFARTRETASLRENNPDRPDRTRFARTEFERLDKGKLRKVLSGEQASLCVYCERRLSENGWPPPIVEHWIPLSGAPEYALHWRNLYLSCATRDTCDGAKRDRRLRWDDADPDLPWPTELDYERLVGFDSDGRMYVRDDVNIDGATRKALALAIDDMYVRNDALIDEATRKTLALAIDDLEYGRDRRRAILNLNHPTLMEERRAALDSERRRMERDFENRHATRDEREERAARLLGRDRLPAFVSIRVAWLRKRLGRGRGR